MTTSLAPRTPAARRPAPPTLRARGLTKTYGQRRALDGVDLDLSPGCAHGLLGHNGAGKTTLIRCLLALIRPDAGSVQIGGHDVAQDPRRALAGVGVLLGEPHFHPHLSGRENLQIVAALRGPHALAEIDPALDRVGLAKDGGRKVGAYSQGMRQRLGIARCLIARPQLVIWDEPTNGLDPGAIVAVRELAADLVAQGATVLMSSHLLVEVARMCSRITVLDRGRAVFNGPTQELTGPNAYLIGCSDPLLAAHTLAAAGIGDVAPTPGGIRVRVPAEMLSTIAHLLADAQITVFHTEPLAGSIEERFFELTGGTR